jgi:hypothetical protein
LFLIISIALSFDERIAGINAASTDATTAISPDKAMNE